MLINEILTRALLWIYQNWIMSIVVVSSRTTYKNDKFQGETQLLMPVSLDLEVQRNLASNWYHRIPDIEITAHLMPLSVSNSTIEVVLWCFLIPFPY